jgi:hypothetical protein
MLKVIIVASLAASAAAFRPAPMVRSSAVKLSMTAEGLAGESAPFGYFDPLGLSDGKSIGDVRVNDNTTYRQNLTLHKTYW